MTRSDEVPPEINLELENWARVVRSYPERAVSMTGIACQRLKANAKHYHAPPLVLDAERFDKPDPPNERKGWLAERAWVSLPDREKMLLKAVYILKLQPEKICRVCHLHHREWKGAFRRAALMMSARIEILERALDIAKNPAQDSRTT